MTDLFDYASSIAAKAEGMGRVARGANPAWVAAMSAFVVQVARSQPYFISDDVFALAQLSGLGLVTRDYRAFGPVMLRAAKAGVCCKADAPPINSARRTLHASPRQQWRSLIYIDTLHDMLPAWLREP